MFLKLKTFGFGIAVTVLLSFVGQANASSIITDGDFLQPIGTNLNLTPWSDWTAAGITRNSAPDGIQGNYASLPVGADLFQRFNALANGGYVLSFLVRNQSPTTAKLVFAVQEALGTSRSVVFAAGTGAEVTLLPSDHFTSETLTFYIDNPSFIPNELAFSNSYDAAVPPIEDSINPSGTILDIAAVTLCRLSSYPCAVTPYVTAAPEPATWAVMLFGTFGLLAFGKRQGLRRQAS